MLSPQYYAISLPLGYEHQQERFPSLCLLGLVVKSVPGIIIVGREHMPVLDTAGEVVMAVEVPDATDLNAPGATAGAAGHIAGDGDHRSTPMLPAAAQRTLAGLPCPPIERRRCDVAIGVERLIDRPTI